MITENAVLLGGFVKLLSILSIKVLLFLETLVGRRVWGCSELEARSSRNMFT